MESCSSGEAINGVVNNAICDIQLSPTCCDVSNRGQQTVSIGDITRVAEETELGLAQQVTELKRQVSLQSQQLEAVSIKLHHMVSAILLLQSDSDDRQMMPANEQHRLCNRRCLSAADVQQATTAERQALMDDDTRQRVHIIAAMAAIGASTSPKRSTEDEVDPKLMLHDTDTTLLPAVKNKAVETLMLERLENMARAKQHMTLHEFSESTTFHGLKYIIQGNVTLRRRVLWFVAWLTAVVLLSLLVKQKLDYLYSYPSSVNMWDEHVKSLPFPAVTVCNKNPYRISKVADWGMYDIVRMKADFSDYDHNYFYNDSVCTVPPVSIFTQTIVSTSLAVCQRLCNDTRFYDSTCSGLFWFRHNQSCTLTSYTGNGEMNNCSATNALDHVMYFRRIRYVHTRPIYCTFDDDIDTGACPLKPSNEYIYQWVTQVVHPINDVTTNSRYGKVLWVNSSIAEAGRTGILAEITTPLVNTTGKCLMLSHFVMSNNLRYMLQVISESLTTVISHDLTAAVRHRHQWNSLSFQLPPELHWIKLTASAQGLDGLTRNLIDDLSILPCNNYTRECLLSAQGFEYLGKASVTYNGSECMKWNDIDANVTEQSYTYMNSRQIQDRNFIRQVQTMLSSVTDSALYLQGKEMAANKCMFIAKHFGDVECYDGSRLTSCNVPYCACATGWHQCPSGQCLPNRMSADKCQKRPPNDPVVRHSVSISRPDENLFLSDETSALPQPNMQYAFDKLVAYEQAEFRDVIVDLSPAQDNFMLQCQWETGEQCIGHFQQRFTEMGLCYTFNANSSTLIYSNAVGEIASGLQLTLNTQSSEIIDKVGQNGLKILLFDPSKDVELMSDYGINISPGFYTTIGVSLEQVTTMKAPYGTCNDIKLRHTDDTYSYSRCVLDHETSSFIQDCNCSMPYMSGQYDQCTTREYLTCSHFNDTQATDCPSHCNTTVFNMKLSSTTLSTGSTLNQFTPEQKRALQATVERAYETHSRVDYRHMIEFIQVFDNNLIRQLDLAEKLVEEKVLKQADKFLMTKHLDAQMYNRAGRLSTLKNMLLGDNSHFANMFVHHVSEFRTEMHAFIQYVHGLIYEWDYWITLDDLVCAARSITAAASLVLRDGVNVQAELKDRCKKAGTRADNCIDEFLNLTRATLDLLERFPDYLHPNGSNTDWNSVSTSSVCFYGCNDTSLGLDAFLSDLDNIAPNYLQSQRNCYDNFEKLAFLLYRKVSNLPDTDLPDRFKSLLKYVHFRSAKEVLQSNLLDVLHKNVTRLTANTNLKATIETLAARVSSLKYLAGNILQVYWPQLLKEGLDSIINIDKQVLRGSYLISLYFRPWENNSHVNNNEHNLLDTVERIIRTVDEAYMNELNTTYEDLSAVAFTRQDIEIILPNDGKPNGDLIVDELLKHTTLHVEVDETIRAMSVVHDEVLAQLRSLEHYLIGILHQTTAYTNSLRIDDNFVRDNIAVVKIYFIDMNIKHTDQSAAYSWSAFFSDLGGSLGLLLGASVLSLIEVLDMCFYNFTVYACRK